MQANQAVLVTAARLRMLPNLKSLVWAAARDGQRSPLYTSLIRGYGLALSA
jgi:hypothetical protein